MLGPISFMSRNIHAELRRLAMSCVVTHFFKKKVNFNTNALNFFMYNILRHIFKQV